MSGSSDGDVRVQVESGVVEIVLSRPARKNALTLAMYDAMTAALADAKAGPATAVLLRGEGGVFTSGNDLQDFMQRPPTGEDSPVFRFLEALVAFDKPLVAAVSGPAIGVGTTMLMHCDLVYASETARFQLPFVNLGLVPEAGSSLLLPRLAGHVRAAELLFFGEPFGAAYAREIGLVNAVLPEAALLDHVRGRLAALSEKPPTALRETKRLLKGLGDPDAVRARMQAEAAVFLERLASPEVAEAISAFFEKRKPSFPRG
jgi:enoyl-CoA hydratase/carnithine racemase